MKNSIRFAFRFLLLVSLLAATFGARAQGTAFTYQGLLDIGGAAANGSYDLTFALFSNSNGAGPIGAMITNLHVPVTNGLFATKLDFGPVDFGASGNWVQIAARASGGSAFTNLSPLLQVTPAPYALSAGSASSLSGTVASAGLSGAYTNAVTLSNVNNVFVGNGAGLGNVWLLNGNAGTAPGPQFLGTTDPSALEIRVGNVRAVRLEPSLSGPNVLIGSSNYAEPGTILATISGGGTNNIEHGADISTIGGGANNTIESNSYWSTIGGGWVNTIESNSRFAAISGGSGVTIQSGAAAAVIAGGTANQIGTNAQGAAIGGGTRNLVSSNASSSVIAGGTLNIIETNAQGATIAGGAQNTVNSNFASIGGGSANLVSNEWATVPGGCSNVAAGLYSFAAGQQARAANDGAFVWADSQTNFFTSAVNDSFNIRARGGVNVFTSGAGILLDGRMLAGSIGGSLGNSIAASADAVIGAGESNAITEADWSVIAGGSFNTVASNSFGGVIGGGSQNTVNSNFATIGGGAFNTASNRGATVPGGMSNNAAGAFSFAAGFNANATNDGAFVWADSQTNAFSSTNNDSFNVRAQGGVCFSDGSTNAVSWTPGSGSWNFASDRNLKERFENVDAASVLDKVSRLPVSEWSYRGHGQRHIGAMAQDFHALFPLNDNDKVLNDTDLHGVELAAIKGLNEKLESELKAKDAENQVLQNAIADLKAAQAGQNRRFQALEQAIESLGGGKTAIRP